MNKDIFKAISQNDIKKVKLFLDSGIDVNCRDTREKGFFAELFNGSNVWYDYTPLIQAVAYENSKIVTLLLKYGANIYLEDSLSFTARSFPSRLCPEMKTVLDAAQQVEDVVKKNSIDELCTILAKEPVHNRYLLYYALFHMTSKQQFELFKEECEKNGIFKLDEMLYKSSFPPLIINLLKKNIWLWRHEMFKKFPTLQQKKEMMIYQYNDQSVSRVAYDLMINYKK